MFEKAPPIPHTRIDRFENAPVADSQGHSGETQGDTALRSFDWDELSARLSAARDLRDVLQSDNVRTIGDHAHDFADAAARFFRTKEERQSNVNPVALGQSKGSPGMFPEQTGPHDDETNNRGLPENGDARED